MPKRGKNYKEALKEFDRQALYTLDEGIELVKKTAKAKYNETVESHIRLGIDPRRSDQNVRGTVVLPHGTGKTPKVIVFTQGDKIDKAKAAGADEVGYEELIERVKGGWMDWDVACASPDAMAMVGKNLGRVLGPKMPSPKAGTVNMDVETMVSELKSGKVQYRADKTGIVHTPVGKVSFDDTQLKENMKVLVDAILRAKPAAAKGAYFKSMVLASTHGPGIKLDPSQVQAELRDK